MSNKALRWARASRGLTPTQKLVLFVLADAANDETFTCWNAAASIADETGLSDRAVRMALHDLIDAGAITGVMRSGVRPNWLLAVEETGTTFHPKRKGVPVSKRKHVPTNRKQVPSKPEPRSVKAEPVSDEPSRTINEPSRTQISLISPDAGGGDPFEAWWLAYPRKVGKDAARKSYAAALKRGATHAVLAYAIGRQSWPDDKTFIPHAATWLNQGRWQDAPTDAAPPPPKRESKVAAWAGLFGDLPADEATPFDFDLTAEEVP